MFAEVHCEPVREQATGHATDREPHSMKPELSSPDCDVALEDPVVE